jgi:transposase
MVYESMRGKTNSQPQFCVLISVEDRIPQHHPLRAIKRFADEALRRLRPALDALYAEMGRPSIPPEHLLKARILTALYSVRSERLFCEQLAYNFLWMWFLDRDLDAPTWNHSVFAKNQERLLSSEVARAFFEQVYQLSREQGWASDAHFSADGTLIESWASLKSFARKDGADAAKTAAAKKDDPGNPTIDFKGERRSNDTHQSTTDPEAVLYRKAKGREARLSFGGQVLMENRGGLCAAITIHNPIADSESVVSLHQLQERKRKTQVNPRSVGGDKLYHNTEFISGCRRRGIQPHVALKERVRVQGLDGRTTAQRGYQTSQRIRKRVEEIFGWMKTVGGLRRSRYRGRERTQGFAYFVASAYNLLRMAKLQAVVVRS